MRSLTSIYSYIQRWKVNLRLTVERGSLQLIFQPFLFLVTFCSFLIKSLQKNFTEKLGDRKIFKEKFGVTKKILKGKFDEKKLKEKVLRNELRNFEEKSFCIQNKKTRVKFFV